MGRLGLKSLTASLVLAAGALGLSAQPASAGAIITYNLDLDGCSGGCGASNYGTIVVSDISGGGVKVNVSLLNGAGLIDDSALGNHVLVLNLAGHPTVHITGLPSSWTASPTTFTTNGGFGTFDYYLNCNSACSSSNPWTSPLNFTITNTSITTASFLTGGTSKDAYFVADISNPRQIHGHGYGHDDDWDDEHARTGRVGATFGSDPSDDPVQVPEPFTISLFSAALAGMATLRRRKSISGAAVA
jgi:hypothetical protein